MNLLKQFFSQNSHWQINKDFARVHGLECAILISDLVDKWIYFGCREWTFNTTENIQRDTTLTRHQQDKYIKKLVEFGFIEYNRKNAGNRKQFKINENKLLEFFKCRLLKSDNLECEKPTVWNAENQQSHINKNKEINIYSGYNNLSVSQIETVLNYLNNVGSENIQKEIKRLVTYKARVKKDDEDKTIISEIENRLEFYKYYGGNKMHLAIVFRFYDLLIEKYPNSSTLIKAELEAWLKEVRLSIENDGTSVERLIAIIEFLKWQVKEVKGIDTFWITQVQSISSIRGKNTQGVFKIDNIASKMNEYINRCPEFKVHIDKEITNFTNKFKTN